MSRYNQLQCGVVRTEEKWEKDYILSATKAGTAVHRLLARDIICTEAVSNI